MACEECQGLVAHEFRSPDDLIHALRTAAEEANRGVLAPVDARERGVAEQEALYSALEAGAAPGKATYRFRCTTCGDAFTLMADMATGAGSWSRDPAAQ
jgi:cytochrome c5